MLPTIGYHVGTSHGNADFVLKAQRRASSTQSNIALVMRPSSNPLAVRSSTILDGRITFKGVEMATKGRGNQQSVRTQYLRSHPAICSGCGYDGFIEVHHILPVSEGGTNDPDNLTVLCEVCHDLAHGKKNKKNFIDPNRANWSPTNG